MNTETKVGAFVIGCSVLLGVTVYFVGSNRLGRHLTPFKTYMRYAGGISAGSDVLFGGINVGRVTAVGSWSDDPTQIEISMAVKEGTPINVKSVARLGAVSVMSAPAISITTGTRDAHRLGAGQVIASQETVSIDDMVRKVADITDNAAVLITQVQGELKSISGQADTLLTSLNNVAGADNRKEIASILRQVNELVSTQTPKIDQITSQVLQTTRDADATIGKAGPLLEHADATVANVNTTIDQLRDPIRQDLTQLQTTMEQAKSLIASMQTVVRSNEGNLRETLENIRIASENLDQLTDQVKQRPWSLVRIRQPEDRQVPQKQRNANH